MLSYLGHISDKLLSFCCLRDVVSAPTRPTCSKMCNNYSSHHRRRRPTTDGNVKRRSSSGRARGFKSRCCSSRSRSPWFRSSSARWSCARAAVDRRSPEVRLQPFSSPIQCREILAALSSSNQPPSHIFSQGRRSHTLMDCVRVPVAFSRCD